MPRSIFSRQVVPKKYVRVLPDIMLPTTSATSATLVRAALSRSTTTPTTCYPPLTTSLSPKMMILLPFIAAAYVVQIIPVTTATRQDLVVGVNRLSSDVIALRNEIERSISNRCASIRGCYKSSYGECQSEYTTQQTCPSIDEIGFAISDCGSGKRCNGLFDKSITTVRIPATLATGENGNPTNPEVVEAICYTRTAQAWMVNKYNQDKEVWKSLGVDSPQMFFGSSTGVFRIFPARQSRECGSFDPRLRPWYQASVSTCYDAV